jgi:hypothetical protein
MRKGKPKTATRDIRGAGVLVPRTGAQPPSGQKSHEYPVISFRYTDRADNGGWSWLRDDEAKLFVGFLCDTANSTWNEIRQQTTGSTTVRPKYHGQDFQSLSKQAQDLIRQRRHDEIFERIHRFRLGGTERLWGFEKNGVFYVLWWDRDHCVDPQTRD